MSATKHRFNVNFTDSAWRTLQDLAERRGKTMAEVIRDAIALEVWFERTRAEGSRILVERNGSIREIVPRD